MAAGVGIWRDCARYPRFFMIDAYTVFPLLLWLVHMRFWTFYIAIATIIFFAILERFDFTVPIFFRWLRSTIAGRIRLAHSEWRE